MTLQDQENIIAFLRNELSEFKRQKFLDSLTNNQELAHEFELHKKLFESLGKNTWSEATQNNLDYQELLAIAKSEQISELRHILEATSAKHKMSSNWKVFKKWKLLSVAALTLALVGIFSIFDSNPNYQELFEQYEQKSSVTSTIERGKSQSDIEVQIETAYRKKEYRKAVILTHSLSLDTITNASIFLYLGDSYTKLNEYSKAIHTFDQLIGSNLLDAQKGYWFKALTYLKMEDPSNIRATLEYIIANKLYNDWLAEELLRKI